MANRLAEIKARLDARGHNGANVYDVGSTHASADIKLLLGLVRAQDRQIKSLTERLAIPATEKFLVRSMWEREVERILK